MEKDMMNTQSNDTNFPGIWDELLWRGLVKVSTDQGELRTLLNDQKISFYCGFDPTASSLHLGNLVQLLLMRRLQLAGHTPFGLVGGSTGLIGDPRPTSERTLNDPATVAGWVNKLQAQVEKFLNPEGANGLRLVNNLDWFGQLSALDFLRDFGKFFRVNTMLKKDAVRSRLESDAGISFTEFSYQILQASDFLELFRNESCVLQTGGSDQWGNLLGGVELVSRVEGQKVHALGTPLITNTDGTKFGKSEGNAVWLDPEMTTPFEFFQFWLNTADEDVIDRLKVFTFLKREQVRVLELQVLETPHLREAQKVLAFEVTALVHGVEVAEEMVEVSRLLFSLEELSGVREVVLKQVFTALEGTAVSSEMTVAAAAVAAGLVSSLGEARRVVKQNGLSLNNKKVADADAVLSSQTVLAGGFLLMKKGKKQMALLQVQ
jgi:tyrosyl-tRNA synthetase